MLLPRYFVFIRWVANCAFSVFEIDIAAGKPQSISSTAAKAFVIFDEDFRRNGTPVEIANCRSQSGGNVPGNQVCILATEKKGELA